MNTTAFEKLIARAWRVLLVATLLVGLALGGRRAGGVAATASMVSQG